MVCASGQRGMVIMAMAIGNCRSRSRSGRRVRREKMGNMMRTVTVMGSLGGKGRKEVGFCFCPSCFCLPFSV